jgi:hypothetical protein
MDLHEVFGGCLSQSFYGSFESRSRLTKITILLRFYGSQSGEELPDYQQQETHLFRSNCFQRVLGGRHV